MSKYTTELRYPLEQRFKELNPDREEPYAPYSVCTNVDCRTRIFDFYYPINADDKERFETNFLMHYYTREIGLETLGLFKQKLNAKLLELIPKYNMLWNQLAEMSTLDIYSNTDLKTIRKYGQTINDSGNDSHSGSDLQGYNTNTTRTGSTEHSYDNFKDVTETKKTGDDTDTTTYTGTESRPNNVTERVSDTPMGTIDNMTSITGNMYLSGAKITTQDSSISYNNRQDTDKTSYNSSTTSTRTPTGKELEKYNDIKETKLGTDTMTYGHNIEHTNNRTHGGQDEETISGKNGGKSYIEDMLKARQLFINIDLMLIDELRTLFMQVW